MFCEKEVSHFARHLYAWHNCELDVQRILSYQKDSSRRKLALSQLRKKGNFIRNRVNTQNIKRVRRLPASAKALAEDYLPCRYCLGYYKRKSLYRHTKRCPENTDLEKGKRQTAQIDGQNTPLSTLKHDKLLTSELFPRMRADDVTLTAKKDQLICNYAYSYLKSRRSKGNFDCVRQNVRRLSKLLMFAKERVKDVKCLMDLLRPCLFKQIVDGVNKLACYNSDTDLYESPTLAMNFGMLLKKNAVIWQ